MKKIHRIGILLVWMFVITMFILIKSNIVKPETDWWPIIIIGGGIYSTIILTIFGLREDY